ncbi:hypothetical protein CASFOL_003091 [Castilleja foliolosa]|uniref:Uncharacterized protein n=1 Tax=Castilleja foliolosa TaxID=1961234 RepID=A0ABD3EJV7_9LAMI
MKFDKNYFNNQANKQDDDRKKKKKICHGKMVYGKQTNPIVTGYRDNPETFLGRFSEGNDQNG